MLVKSGRMAVLADQEYERNRTHDRLPKSNGFQLTFTMRTPPAGTYLFCETVGPNLRLIIRLYAFQRNTDVTMGRSTTYLTLSPARYVSYWCFPSLLVNLGVAHAFDCHNSDSLGFAFL